MKSVKESGNYKQTVWTVYGTKDRWLSIHRTFGDIGNPAGHHTILLEADEAEQLRDELNILYPVYKDILS